MALPESYYEFVDSYDDGKHETDPRRIANRTVYHRLLDIAGEAERARKAWAKWRAEGTPESLRSLERQMDLVERLCYTIYNDEGATRGMKRSLRVAEWELNDFFFGENAFHNTEETVTRWFTQWTHSHAKADLTRSAKGQGEAVPAA